MPNCKGGFLDIVKELAGKISDAWLEKFDKVYADLTKNTYDPSGWDGNLDPSKDTLQKIFDTLDDLPVGVDPEGNIQWGTISGNIQQQTDLINLINQIAAGSTEILEKYGIIRYGTGKFRDNYIDKATLDTVYGQEGDFAFVGEDQLYIHNGTEWIEETEKIDTTAQLKQAMEKESEVILPSGVYYISDTFVISNAGMKFVGAGKRNTFFVNKVNDKRLMDIGDIYNLHGYAYRATVGGFSLVGNASTKAGVTIWSRTGIAHYKNETGDSNIVGDNWYNSSSNCHIVDIDCEIIGNGIAWDIQAWAGLFDNPSVSKYPGQDTLTKVGMCIHEEANAVTINNPYISHCGEESLKGATHGDWSTAVTINNLTLQMGGRADQRIPILFERAQAWTINGMYIELRDFGDGVIHPPAMHINSACNGIKINGLIVLNQAVKCSNIVLNEGQGTEIGYTYFNFEVTDVAFVNSGWDAANKTRTTPASTASMTFKGATATNTVAKLWDANHRGFKYFGSKNIELSSYDSSNDTNLKISSYHPTLILNDIASVNNEVELFSDDGNFTVAQKATGKKLWDIAISSGTLRTGIKQILVDQGDNLTVNYGVASNINIIRPASDGMLSYTSTAGNEGKRGHIIIYNSEHITDFSSVYAFEGGTKPTLTGKSVLEYLVQTSSAILITNVTTGVA